MFIVARQYNCKCPHCGSYFPVRSSYEESPILRRVYLQCTNIECGFSAQAFIEIKYELSPSGAPNPEITLLKSPAKQKKEVACV